MQNETIATDYPLQFCNGISVAKVDCNEYSVAKLTICNGISVASSRNIATENPLQINEICNGFSVATSLFFLKKQNEFATENPLQNETFATDYPLQLCNG